MIVSATTRRRNSSESPSAHRIDKSATWAEAFGVVRLLRGTRFIAREESVRRMARYRALNRLAKAPIPLARNRQSFVRNLSNSTVRLGPSTREYRPRRTEPLDENGQGDAHLAFCFAAHRAVVDVDVELGLVRVVEIATAQDVGRAMNPLAVEGQLEGGIAQGLGLALMEEIQLTEGRLRNASFTDYLIPTILDMPPMRLDILEYADPHAPYGLRGAGEPPTLSSTPAITAAIRDATGLPLRRVPLRPEHITDPSWI